MKKYNFFVSYFYLDNSGKNGYGNCFFYSDNRNLSEIKIREMERVLREGNNFSQITILNFQPISV